MMLVLFLARVTILAALYAGDEDEGAGSTNQGCVVQVGHTVWCTVWCRWATLCGGLCASLCGAGGLWAALSPAPRGSNKPHQPASPCLPAWTRLQSLELS